MVTNVLEQIGKVSKQVIFSYNTQTRTFDYINKAFELIWQRSADILNDPSLIISTIHPDDKEYVQDLFQELLNDDTYKQLEFKIVLPDEKVKVMSMQAYAIINDQGKPYWIVGFANDITQAKEYETYLIDFGAKKNSTLQIVAHDLSGPLSIVQSIANSLDKESDLRRIGTFTEIIRKVCQESINLISELVMEEHLDSPNVYVKKEWIDLVYKINSTVENYKSVESIKQIFTVEPAAEKIFAEVDEIKFLQIITNLITNAIKFTQSDGTIKLSVQENDKTVIITISDNGIGIPQNLQPHIFEKFTKAGRPGLRGEKSTGIGLSIVKKLVELHGGTIGFSSKENQGTTFIMEFPKNGRSS